MIDEEPSATGLPPGHDSDGDDVRASPEPGRRRRNIRALYAAEWTLFRERRSRFFALCLAIFLAAILIGHVYFQAHPDQAAGRVTQAIQQLSRRGLLTEKGAGLFLGILLNNVRATLIILAVGLVPYLFLSALGPLFNGGLVGMFTAYLQHTGFSLARAVWAGLAPHGVLEIPAVLYAASLGLDLALLMTKKMRPTAAAGSPSPVELLLRALRSWALVTLPLLCGASAVEAFITPALLRL